MTKKNELTDFFHASEAQSHCEGDLSPVLFHSVPVEGIHFFALLLERDIAFCEPSGSKQKK